MQENFQAMATLAAAKMRPVFPVTPLLKNELLSERFGAEIWLKREDLTPVRSYKLRGAFNAMRKVRDAGFGLANARDYSGEITCSID